MKYVLQDISKCYSPIRLKPPLNTGADKKFYTLGKPPFYNIMNQINTEHIKHDLIFVASTYHQHTAGTAPSKPTTSALTLCDHTSGYLFIKTIPQVLPTVGYYRKQQLTKLLSL